MADLSDTSRWWFNCVWVSLCVRRHVAILLGTWWMAEYETLHVCRVPWCQQCVNFWWWPSDPIKFKKRFKKFICQFVFQNMCSAGYHENMIGRTYFGGDQVTQLNLATPSNGHTSLSTALVNKLWKNYIKQLCWCTTLYNLHNCPLVVTLFGLQKTVTLYFKFKNIIHLYWEWGIPYHLLPPIDHREEVSGCWSARLVCWVWRDCRRIHHWCDGRAQIQSCCQASQDRVLH